MHLSSRTAFHKEHSHNPASPACSCQITGASKRPTYTTVSGLALSMDKSKNASTKIPVSRTRLIYIGPHHNAAGPAQHRQVSSVRKMPSWLYRVRAYPCGSIQRGGRGVPRHWTAMTCYILFLFLFSGLSGHKACTGGGILRPQACQRNRSHLLAGTRPHILPSSLFILSPFSLCIWQAFGSVVRSPRRRWKRHSYFLLACAMRRPPPCLESLEDSI